MKKSLVSVLVLTTLVSLGTAFAQSESHDVTIKIPEMLGVRIVDSGGDLATNPGVTFDYQDAAYEQDYIDAVNAGGDDLDPTAVTQFAGLQVLYNAGGWHLTAAMGAITFTDDFSASLLGSGISASDITVTPTGTPGAGVTNVVSSFDLSTTSDIATGSNTTGWSEVGISGDDYTLTVNGDEDPGTYTATVTFTLAAL